MEDHILTTNSFIVQVVKKLLEKETSQLSIKLAIKSIEAESEGKIYVLDNDCDVLNSQVIKDLLVKDGKILAMAIHEGVTFSEVGIGTKKIHPETKGTLCQVDIAGGKFRFFITEKVGNSKVVTSDVALEVKVNDIFNYWLETIGNEKEIYKITPRLTKSRQGRRSAIVKALSELKYDVPVIKEAILGCSNSLYHMGYNNNGTKKDKTYCDLQNILRNSQRIESLASLSGGINYKKQLIQRESQNEVLDSGYTVELNLDNESSLF